MTQEGDLVHGLAEEAILGLLLLLGSCYRMW